MTRAPLVLARDLGRWPVVRLSHPPGAWPWWSPHVVVFLGAAVSGVAGGVAVGQVSSLVLAVFVGVLQGLPLVLCLYRPMAGLWLSLVVSVLVSELVRDGGTAPVWADSAVPAHLGVLGLAGWRAGPRVLVEMWGLTLLAGAVLAQRTPPGYDQQDLVEMAVLSAAVLIAVGALRGLGQARRRLVEQERLTAREQDRRAVLEERSRIARELHDVLAHHMSVIAIQAEAAPHRVADPPEPLTAGFALIGAHARDALTELRRVLGVLRADDAEAELAPQPTLRDLPGLAATARDTGLDVTTEVTGRPRPLPPGVEVSAYRIVQEALNNAMRHAPGSRVRIEVDYRPGELRLAVRNGPASTGTTVSSIGRGGSGHGLRGMRERVEVLGGELEVGATGDGGHRVTAVLPLEEER
ncbi:sensor histidine kinase [Saccharothrix syringae]|uniref:sensor histidine kinase n=1 Tax=Saccharothrix syringae TaxID=103733 RepID=UPI000A584157|nr:sensor histidine kinase [Saccharothrix syringae]